MDTKLAHTDDLRRIMRVVLPLFGAGLLVVVLALTFFAKDMSAYAASPSAEQRPIQRRLIVPASTPSIPTSTEADGRI